MVGTWWRRLRPLAFFHGQFAGPCCLLEPLILVFHFLRVSRPSFGDSRYEDGGMVYGMRHSIYPGSLVCYFEVGRLVPLCLITVVWLFFREPLWKGPFIHSREESSQLKEPARSTPQQAPPPDLSVHQQGQRQQLTATPTCDTKQNHRDVSTNAPRFSVCFIGARCLPLVSISLLRRSWALGDILCNVVHVFCSSRGEECAWKGGVMS